MDNLSRAGPADRHRYGARMPQPESLQKPASIVEGMPDRAVPPALQRRLMQLERLVLAIEDELSDDELSDEQKLQNIGERVAAVTD